MTTESREFSGSLRERIRIERLDSVRDALGSTSQTRELVGEYWAAALANGTGPETAGESRSAMQQWRFILRHTREILPGDYLLWRGRHMMISAVDTEYRPVAKTILLAEETR